MIANLPLLFCDGNPTGLSKITTPQLERFITFMVTCSWGHDTVREILQPAWWPADVDFAFPFIRPRRVPADWDVRLKRLVRQCYDYHKSAFLLVFSAQLSRHPRSRLRYVDNRDHTTSLYHKPSGRLLVTFRNENLFYDKTPPKLPAKRAASPDLITPDIYLCDNCDSHFDNPKTLKTHERLCNAVLPRETIECGNGLPDFLKALKLKPVGDETDTPVICEVLQPTRNSRSSAGVDRGSIYPFSSLTGQKTARPITRDHSLYLDKVERYCCTLPINSKNRWGVSVRTGQFPVKYRRPIDYWHRKQTFPDQRKKQLLDLTGQLLLLKCRPVRVNIERMSLDAMNRYIEDLRTAAATRAEEDIEFVSESVAELPMESQESLARSDPLEKCEEVIDLCSDDETPSVKENSDPMAGVTCVVRGGAVLRRTHPTTPRDLPAEPCGAARRRPANVLQPQPVILFTETVKVPIISLD